MLTVFSKVVTHILHDVRLWVLHLGSWELVHGYVVTASGEKDINGGQMCAGKAKWISYVISRLPRVDTWQGGNLLKDVRVLHFAVVLGKFDRKDDAGDEEDQAPPQAEPECILRSGGGEEVDIMQSKRKMFFTM